MAKSSKKRQKTSKRARRRGEAPREVRQTKKQIARSRREARQRRIIWAAVAALAAIIVIVLTIGLLQELVLKPGRPVATVNGVKLPTDDYQALLQYRRYNLHLEISNLQNGLQSLDASDEANELLINFYQQQLGQLQTALDTIADTALDELIDDELVRQKAEELEITVSDDEVQETINEQIQQAMTAASQQAITDTEQIVTPTPIPQDQLDEFYRNAIDNMGLSNREFRDILERSLLRNKVQEHLASQVPTTGQVVHVQMIMTDSEEEALAAQQRVEEGEDFASVAADVSVASDATENGGDMGWLTPDQLASRYGEDLADHVSSLAVDEMGQVQSNETFYVVEVLERDENGPLPEEVLTPRQNSALEDWLAEQKASPDVQIERLLEPDQIPPDPFLQPPGF
jgi:peptidyl-prolyl cis-trans isomerase SurA